MARISSVSSAMEAYYKLTQSQLTENEIKKELSKENQKQSSDISTLDDVRDAIGIIKDEVQFLNKAKDTFNEIYDILDEAYNYLKNLNQKDMESNEASNLKVKLDGYINEINKITDNTHNVTFSNRMVQYIDKLTSIDLSNIGILTLLNLLFLSFLIVFNKCFVSCVPGTPLVKKRGLIFNDIFFLRDHLF